MTHITSLDDSDNYVEDTTQHRIMSKDIGKFFYIDARGAIIKIPLYNAKIIPLFNVCISRWNFDNHRENPFYLDYSPDDVHKILNSLNTPIEDFLMFEKKNDKILTKDLFDVGSSKLKDIYVDQVKVISVLVMELDHKSSKLRNLHGSNRRRKSFIEIEFNGNIYKGYLEEATGTTIYKDDDSFIYKFILTIGRHSKNYDVNDKNVIDSKNVEYFIIHIFSLMARDIITENI